MRKIIKRLASVKFAVVVILALAALIATGTFVEAHYNAEIAGKLVYKTPWMFTVMGFLCSSLIAVMVDRWPWKRRHLPFLLAHIGILLLLTGSLLTMLYGIDGSMYFEIGHSSHTIQVNKEELTIWHSSDGEHFTSLQQSEVDFFSHPPKNTNYSFQVGKEKISIVDYWPFVAASSQVMPSQDSHFGAAVRFQMQNGMANVNDWLLQKDPKDHVVRPMGPAQIHFGVDPNTVLKDPKKGNSANELFVFPRPDGKTLAYVLYSKDPSRGVKKGELSEGASLNTGWNNFEFRILRYYPRAEEKWKVEQLEQPTSVSSSAIKVRLNSGEERWLQLEDSLKFFVGDEIYVVSYGHQHLDLGLELTLREFKMGTYPGTNRPASYESLVTLPNAQPYLISMNEPLKSQGYTFYQASFQNGPDGKPLASILSVNRDPGRPLKYLGSLIISLGIIYLFYDRRKAASLPALKAREVHV